MHDDQLPDGAIEARCADLKVDDVVWDFAVENASAIDQHWDEARRANPLYFNGRVYLTRRASLRDGIVVGQVFPAEFKSVLYWRSLNFPKAGAIDGFGSALIRTLDGGVVIGRQRGGQINSGLTYLPGGFFDDRDVSADGSIDLAGSVLRELEEETGLGVYDGSVAPGLIVTRAGHQLSFAISFFAALPADALVDRINARLEADPQSELERVVAVRSASELDGVAMPAYARTLLHRLFASP